MFLICLWYNNPIKKSVLSTLVGRKDEIIRIVLLKVNYFMKKILSLGLALGLPMVALAQTTITLVGVVGIIGIIVNYVTPVLVAIAVAYFIWGVVQYTIAASDEEAKKAGRGKIINGLIGLFVIIAFWGIIRIFTNTFQISNDKLQENQIPCVPNTALSITCPQ
jgi:hypothetical protein